MNLFPLEVVEQEGGPALRLAGGTLRLPEGTRGRRLLAAAAERAAVAGLRPEALAWPGKDDERPRLQVEAAAVEMLGHEEILYLRSPAVVRPDGRREEGLLAARVGVGRRPEPGEEITLAVDPDALHLFDAEGRCLDPPL